MSLHVIIGTDRYLCRQERKKYEGKQKYSEFNEGHFNDFGEEVMEFIRSVPFMESTKTCFVNVEGLAALNNNKLFTQVLSAAPKSVTIVVTVEAVKGKTVNRSSKLYKGIQAAGVLTVCDKFKNEGLLRKFIGEWLAEHNAQMAQDAMSELIRRVNYLNRDDIDGFGVVNALTDVASVREGQVIDKHTVELFVPDNEKSNAFMLVKLLQQHDMNGLTHQCNLVLSEDHDGGEVLKTLGLVLYHFRIAFKYAVFGSNADISSGYSNARTDIKCRNVKVLKRCIRIITENIKARKTGLFSNEDALMFTMEQLISLI